MCACFKVFAWQGRRQTMMTTVALRVAGLLRRLVHCIVWQDTRHWFLTYLFRANTRRQQPLLPRPANNGFWVALRTAFQGDGGSFWNVLLWGGERPDGGRELHVKSVLELHRRVNVEEAEEGACVAWPGVRDDKSRSFNGDSPVSCHLLVPHRQQPFLASVRRKLFDNQLVAAFKED